MKQCEHDILKRVMEVFSTYGIRSLSMDNIAQYIPLSKRNLLKIAKNKEDLIRRIFEYRIELAQEIKQKSKQTANAENVIDEIVHDMRTMYNMSREIGMQLEFELYKYYPRIFAEYTAIRKQHIIESLKDNIERGKQQGMYHNYLDTEQTAKQIFIKNKELIQTYIQQREHEHNTNQEEIMNKCVGAMIETLANEKGKEYFNKQIATLLR